MELSPEEIQERFIKFLTAFSIPDKDGIPIFKYQNELKKIAFNDETNSLVIDFEDLAFEDPDLAELIHEDPQGIIKILEETLKSRLRDINPNIKEERLNRIRLRLRNIGRPVKIRELFSSNLINRLVRFYGIIVKATKVKHILRRAKFQCMKCGTIFTQEFEFEFEKPKQCPNPHCDNTSKFKLIRDTMEFEEYQELTVQELPEELPPGQLPQGIVVILRGDLTGKVRPGDRVKIYGIVRVFPDTRLSEGKKPLFDTYIEALYVESELTEIGELKLTEEDKRRILELKDDPELEKKIYQSIAPAIYGQEIIKKAIAALLFGGVRKEYPDGTKVRGDIHILLIGDPGIGKSQMLKYVAQIAPRGIYATGKGTTTAGLTAAVVKTQDGWALEAGVLVLADKGIACIDEFDKMKAEDRRALHEAMEQQTVSIAKAGIVATLNARASILAAANPKFGRYLINRDLADNIDLPPSLLSRFDLIFIMIDEPDAEKDLAEAEYILGLHAREIKPTPPIPIDLFRKYIQYAREHVFPKLTPEASRKLKEFYMKMRLVGKTEKEEAIGVTPIAITKRQLEALVRLAEAHARMLLKDKVDESDAEFAIELMRESLRQVARDPLTGEIDVTTITTGRSTSRRGKYMAVLDLIKELQEEYPDGVPIRKLVEAAKEKLNLVIYERLPIYKLYEANGIFRRQENKKCKENVVYWINRWLSLIHI